MKPLHAVALLALGIVAARAAEAAGGSLTTGLGVGWAGRYASGDYLGFGQTGVAAASVGWRWTPRLVVRAHLAYLRYHGPAPEFYVIAPSPGPPMRAREVSAEFLPVALGVALYARPGGNLSPFAEIAPALAWTRWSLTGTDPGFSGYEPALLAGGGLRVPWSHRACMELGVRYLLVGSGSIRSADMRRLAGQQRFERMSTLMPFAQLVLGP